MPAPLRHYFLPDLCNTRSIVVLLAVTEALVLAMTLVEAPLSALTWQRFTVISFFMQWVCLLSAATICPLRPWLMHFNPWMASTLAVIIVALVTLLISLVGEWYWPFQLGYIDWLWIVRNCLISAIFAAMGMRYFFVRSQWQFKKQAELRSRLAALQAHIRPHFFFNTLNTVASLIAIDAEQAERMLLDLAHLFRVVLKNDMSVLDISEEIELAQRYLAIEQVRLGERMQVIWQLPERLPKLQVPALLLQPLLENSVYHGIQPSVKGGFITIALTPKQQFWQLTISNSLPEKPAPLQGNQLAQRNTQARLKALSPQSEFTTVAQSDSYQVVLNLAIGRA